MQELSITEFPKKEDLTLARIWRMASKDLHQTFGKIGSAKNKQACAVGAIAFYVSNGRTVSKHKLTREEAKVYWRLRGGYEKHFKICGFIPNPFVIVARNDIFMHSFSRFADQAEQLKV